MCAMYQPTIWNFTDPSMRFTYESMISSSSADCFVMQGQDCSDDGSIESIAKSVGQCFSSAVSKELQLRGLLPGRTVLRTLTSTETLPGDRSRTLVELDLITEVPGATHNELIDVLVTAKRKCSSKVGLDIKILLKAELRSGTFDPGFLTDSRLRSLSAEVR